MLMTAVIAHRGASGVAPENTLRAIALAAEQGAVWVELDVMLTADELPIIFHDTAVIKDKTWQQLQSFQVPAPVGSPELSAPIATLQEAVNLIHQLGMGLNLEIKPTTAGLGELTLQRSLEVLQTCPAIHLVISSFDFNALQAAKALAPNIPRALLYKKLATNWRDAVREYAVRSVHLAEATLLQEDVAQIRALGLDVYIYTVNDLIINKRLVSWGVNGIFSDFPVLFTHLPETNSRRVSAYGEPI